MQIMARLLALAFALAVAPAVPAAAHTELASATPRDGQTLRAAPREVELVFTGELQREFVQVVISDAHDGGQLEIPAPSVAGSTVRQPLPALAAGRYLVAYRVVAADGHPITGQLRFTYAPAQTPNPSQNPAARATGSAAALAQPAQRSQGNESEQIRLNWMVWGGLAGSALVLVGAVLAIRRSRRAQ
jgi:methionine-rich copper-binding protein CopC